MSRRRHRLDGNHQAIRAELEAMGYLFIDCSQTSLGFDAIVVKQGKMTPIEIKDGSLSPSRLKLTPNEQRMHGLLKQYGVLVEILTDSKSLEVLSEPAREFYKP